MISLGKGKSVAAALAYFDRHLQVGDYYSQDASLEGIWRGQLAKRLRLEGHAVNRDALDFPRRLTACACSATATCNA
jgi:hypothetical protein